MPREHSAPNPCIEPGAKGKIPCSRLFYSTVIQVTTLGVHWGEGGEVAPGGRGGKGGRWGRGGCGRPGFGQIELLIIYDQCID